MPKTITQSITFKNQKVNTLYSMFLDSKGHSALTGGNPAKMSAKEGGRFSVWGDYITGKNLQLIKDKLIVQSWLGSDWDKGSLDSTFILLFEQKGKDAIIHMTHANVPDKNVKDIKQGWTDYYWTPWKQYLASMK